jgi:vanillate O-demethylase monooxygenase subunit
MFLRNAWYVAARSKELDRIPKPLKMLGEDIVFFRTQDGLPVALEDACPHRKLPLSMGTLKGDNIECGYHGLTFDCSGKCIDAATQEKIPPSAKVRSYPALDKWGLVWVWMGEAKLADEKKIIQIENYSSPDWHTTKGDAITVGCNYLLILENLLDPSHVAWVHKSSFAAAGTDNTPLKTEISDESIIVSRWVNHQLPPPFYAPLLKFDGECDRLQHYEVRYPATAVNMGIYQPAGQGGDDQPFTDDTYIMISYHFMTPIDERTTRYHWLQHRNTDVNNEGITKSLAEGARTAFAEDKDILEAVQIGLDNARTPHLDLALDNGSLRFRKRLTRMITEEAESE